MQHLCFLLLGDLLLADRLLSQLPLADVMVFSTACLLLLHSFHLSLSVYRCLVQTPESIHFALFALCIGKCFDLEILQPNEECLCQLSLLPSLVRKSTHLNSSH